jgi:thermitase
LKHRTNSARARWLVVGLLLTVILAALVPAFGAAAQSDEPDDEPGQKAIDHGRAVANGGSSPDRLVVVYDNAPGRDHPTRQRVRAQVGGKVVQADSAVGRDVIRVRNGDAQPVAQRLRGTAGVRDAYPDQVATISLAVDDPLLGQEWGLTKIGAPTAWDTAQGAGVTVAVLDCGIHTGHPDLVGRVVLQSNFTTAATTDDRCNHGTHVAGTIAALTNNGTGIAAVAPGVHLLNGKVLDDSGSGFFSDIDRAMQWAADNGARVISMSLGADIPCPAGTQSAADYAWSHGAVIVAAAGNAARSGAGAPANCQNVIGVAATDSADAKASFSNSGPETDVAAPGVSILSSVNPDLNGGRLYASFDGTSMATPHAAGVLALIWSTTYGVDPAAVRARLFETADRIPGTGASWTYGRINAAAAVAGGAAATSTPTSTPTSSPTATDTPPGTTATVTSTPTLTDTPAPPTATPTATATAAPPIAGSDAFAAAPLLGLPGFGAGSNSSATLQGGEPRPCGSINRTVWYRVVPGASGALTASTAGSGYDTVLAIYRGSSLTGLTALACNDDYGGTLQSQVQVQVTAGQTYYVQVGGYTSWSRGRYQLTVSLAPGAAAVAVAEDASPKAKPEREPASEREAEGRSR